MDTFHANRANRLDRHSNPTVMQPCNLIYFMSKNREIGVNKKTLIFIVFIFVEMCSLIIFDVHGQLHLIKKSIRVMKCKILYITMYLHIQI